MNKAIILLLIFLGNSIYSQNIQDDNILEQISEKYNSYDNINFIFDLKYENVTQNINTTKVCSLSIKKNKYILETEDQIITNDAENQWIYLKEINEVQIMKNDTSNNMIRLDQLFNIYKKGFKQSNLKTSDKIMIIDVFPNKSSAFIKIQLHINKEKKQLYKVIVIDKEGGKLSYIISSFETNKNDKNFIFDKKQYPGVEIIDLR
tara:strand:+ start:2820 stop:3434 length:615 start_codon:yes stop_codon:yes gene_type:complete